jgi:signal transduction histidine kinase
MVDRLQQRIERDARFTSDVSHELRSPLTTLAA